MSKELNAAQLFGFGSALSALGLGSNLVTSAISNRRAWKYTQRAMALQYEYQKRGLLEGPALRRKGITDAGYNPLLALGSGSSGSIGNISSPNVPDMSADMPDFSTSAVSAMNGYREGKLLDTNINSAKTELEIKKAQLEKIKAENKTSPENLLTNPEAREEFMKGLPKPLQDAANSALTVANTENKVAKVKETVRKAMPEHYELAKRVVKHIYEAYGKIDHLYKTRNSTLDYIKKLHNTYSAKSGYDGYASVGNKKYKVEYLPNLDKLGQSNLLRR